MRRCGRLFTPTSSSKALGKKLSVVFVQRGRDYPVDAHVGQNLLEVAHANDIDLEGACEGACACSTCHVVLEPKVYDGLPAPTDEEEDMLDLAFGLTQTSRLGCQVVLTDAHDGIRVTVPSATRNLYVDSQGNKKVKDVKT